MAQSATYFSTTAEAYAAQMLENLSDWYQGNPHAFEDAVVAEAERIEEDNPALYARLMETLPRDEWDFDCLACYFLDYCQTH